MNTLLKYSSMFPALVLCCILESLNMLCVAVCIEFFFSVALKRPFGVWIKYQTESMYYSDHHEFLMRNWFQCLTQWTYFCLFFLADCVSPLVCVWPDVCKNTPLHLVRTNPESVCVSPAHQTSPACIFPCRFQWGWGARSRASAYCCQAWLSRPDRSSSLCYMPWKKQYLSFSCVYTALYQSTDEVLGLIADYYKCHNWRFPPWESLQDHRSAMEVPKFSFKPKYIWYNGNPLFSALRLNLKHYLNMQ